MVIYLALALRSTPEFAVRPARVSRSGPSWFGGTARAGSECVERPADSVLQSYHFSASSKDHERCTDSFPRNAGNAGILSYALVDFRNRKEFAAALGTVVVKVLSHCLRVCFDLSKPFRGIIAHAKIH